MNVRDGFIVGIYNYCDRWCETCAFTSRCRVFADGAAMEAARDPTLKAVADAPPLPQDIPPPPPEWMQEFFEEMNKVASEPMDYTAPEIQSDHKRIEARAHAYANSVHAWLEAHDTPTVCLPSNPVSVIRWFQYSIPGKIHRALHGLASDCPDERNWPADHDGSAKVALVGMERSHAAWLELAHLGIASIAEIEPMVSELI